VFRVSGQDRKEWDEGNYTVSIEVVSVDNPAAPFSKSGLGDGPRIPT